MEVAGDNNALANNKSEHRSRNIADSHEIYNSALSVGQSISWYDYEYNAILMMNYIGLNITCLEYHDR